MKKFAEFVKDKIQDDKKKQMKKILRMKKTCHDENIYLASYDEIKNFSWNKCE